MDFFLYISIFYIIERNFHFQMYTDKDDLLTKAKDLLKDELSTISYMTWIKTLEIASVKDNKITLVVLSKMQKDAIETRLYDLILNTFNFITNTSCELNVIEKNELENKKEAIQEEVIDFSKTENYSKTFLMPQYTFDNFVIGNNNKFAQAAAIAVAEGPSTQYNPLFIYGGVGLGKTHLMHAIGNRILEINPTAKVLYVTSEQFTNELINSIKDVNYKNEEFRSKYRSIDVLLIDDIQFLAGKKMGQEEFFHTFNSLFQNGKKIIISSDRPPRDINLLEDRLKSRFEMGLTADIDKPDYETRLAILRKKVQNDNIIIDDYILSVIATKIDSNIRELEGALTKIVAYAAITHSPITIEIAEKSINDLVLQKEKIISSDYIQEVVANYFNIPKADLLSSKKSNDIAYPRQIAMYLCRKLARFFVSKNRYRLWEQRSYNSNVCSNKNRKRDKGKYSDQAYC